jgi:SAM-dependent methyltransferase
MSQNIFDNPEFFAGYYKLRQGLNYNDLLEQPAMQALLPELTGKRVLEIGCGYGENAQRFLQEGAAEVVAIDLSEKMLAVAKKRAPHSKIEYLRLDMAEIAQLAGPFDLIYSSLAFHYAENFSKLMADCYALLAERGRLLYSQEHPLSTAMLDSAGHYNYDEKGRAISYTFSDYAQSGKRVGTWFVENVENYHRPLGEIVTTIAHAGFWIRDLVEPKPTAAALAVKPDLAKEFVKPAFLIVNAQKIGGVFDD